MLTFSDFVLFLYEEKCLVNYFDNIKNDGWFGDKYNVKSRVKELMECPPIEYLDFAFLWKESKEKADFWTDINNKWVWFVNHER